MDIRDATVRVHPDRLPVRDEQEALSATGGDEALALELLATLVKVLPAEVAGLRELFEAKDHAGIDNATHHMRGATAYCGVPALHEALARLRDAAKSGDLEQALTRLERVELEAQRLLAKAR